MRGFPKSSLRTLRLCGFIPLVRAGAAERVYDNLQGLLNGERTFQSVSWYFLKRAESPFSVPCKVSYPRYSVYGFPWGRWSGVTFLAAVTFLRACERLVMVSSFFRHSAQGFGGSTGEDCFSVSPKSQSAEQLHAWHILIIASPLGVLSSLMYRSMDCYGIPIFVANPLTELLPMSSFNLEENIFFILSLFGVDLRQLLE